MDTSNTVKTICLVALCLGLSLSVFSKNNSATEITMMDKVTFRVDTRNITVSPQGMFVAGDFSGPIGIPNWTQIPMCDLGSGIWEISFADIPAGMYQFKFLNGTGGWEFNLTGGPCTSPPNNNRLMNHPGGTHLEGAHCFDTCDGWCAGFGDPGVSDTEPPVITEAAPPNVTLECGDPLPPSLALMADDNCDENATTMTALPVDDLSGLDICGTGDIIRTWTATDCAGNTTSVSQTITLVDTEPPYPTDPIPPDTIYVNCAASIPPAIQLNMADDCDASIVSTLLVTGWLNLTPGCASGQMYREWEITDCSGNEFFTDQIIVRFDDVPPTITGSVPADITLECQNLPPADPLDANDNCNWGMTSTGPPTDDLSGLGPCGTGTVVRTWEATDCDGNTTSVSQIITLTDNTPPVVLNVPPDVTVACGNLPTANTLPATDSCDPGVTTSLMPTDDLSGLGPCGTGTIIRTWEVSDCSGNMASATQSITVEDTAPPIITGAVPADLTLACADPLPIAPSLSASDGCDASVADTGLPTDDLSGLDPCGTGTILRNWEVMDCSGNITSASQTITIVDNVPPVISNSFPPNLIIECDDLPPPTSLLAADDCDPGVVFTDPPTDDLSGLDNCGLGTIVRSWSVVDCSGNLATASQTITLLDSEPPTISGAPADVTVACGNLPAANALSASDGCDLTITQSDPPTDDLSGLSACGLGVVIRTWSVTDCAGNVFSASQNITLEDASAPTIDEPIPADVTVNCGNLPMANALEASDACDATLTTTGIPTDDLSGLSSCGTGELIRTWSVTDCSGNVFSASQTITVEDGDPPVFQNPPQNLNVCVGNVPPMPDLTWEDDCAGTGTVSGTETSDGMTNPETLTRTWTFMDACGNEVTHIQTIVVAESGMANVGPDLDVCDGATVSLSASGAGGAASVLWTTSGDGVFSNPNNENTDYAPGTNDLANGTVTLTFTPSATGSCSIEPDELTLTFLASPSANAGSDQTLTCLTEEAMLDGSGSSGSGSLEYFWAGPGINASNENSENPTVDEPGIYTLTVNVAGQICTSTATVEVFENTDPPSANAGTDQMLTCTSTSVELDGSGNGTGPLEYLWAGSGINASNENLPNPTVSQSGIYTLTVTDQSNGCTASDEVEVTVDGDVPTADAGDDQTIDCLTPMALLDGSNSSTGAGIQLQWFAPDGTPLGTSLEQAVSGGGIFTLTVTNTANGCEISSEVSVSVDTISPAANTGTGGILTCLVTSFQIGEMGMPDFDYMWSGPGINAANENLSDPTVDQPGMYFLEVTDPANGCSTTAEVEIFQNTNPPSANAGADMALDCASPNVALDGTGSTSVGGMVEYLWSGSGIDASNQSLAEPNVSQSGIYTLTVTDPENGCTATDEAEVTTDGDLPTALAGADFNLTCVLDQATLDATGSTTGTGIEYEWTDGSGAVLSMGLTLDISEAATYFFTVSNTQNGCSASDAVMVGLDTFPPSANAGVDMMLDCDSPNVALDGTGSTSTSGMVEYLWSGPGIDASNQNLAQPNVSQSGIYTLTVTDPENGCTATDQTEVAQNGNLPAANAGPDQTLTCSILTVILNGSGSGGGPFTYLWSGPGITPANETEPMPEVGEPGMYSLVVTDVGSGCSSPAATVEVTENTTPPTATIQAPDPLGCQLSLTVLDANSSSGMGSLSFEWSGPGINVGNQNAAAPAVGEPGIYQLTITDSANGCTDTESVEVTVDGDLPPVEISGPATLTCADTLLEISETASAGQPGLEWLWGTSDGQFAQADLTQPSVTLDAPGTYSVTVTDMATGCSSEALFTVGENVEAPVLSVGQTFELGCLSANVDLEVSVSAFSTDLSFIWSGPGFSSMNVSPTVSQSGIYEVTVTDGANGCSASANVEVVQVSGIEEVFVSTLPPDCVGGANGLLTVDSVAGSNPPFEFSLNGGSFFPTNQFENLAAGNYLLTVVDGEGCAWENEYVIFDGASLFVQLGDNVEIDLGESVTLVPDITGAPTVFLWTNVASLDCGNCQTPTAQPTETTVYELTVEDENGCSASDDITLLVNTEVRIYAPNVFSPNGDGINDGFTLFAGNQVSRIERLLIFDRWGGQVFENYDFAPNDPSLGWDGSHRGEETGNGVFVFFANIILVDGREEFIEGEVVLVK